ncbi:MAG: family transcriptional regulator, cyclic receptor protein [Acidimicrobiaceae bacterium]
MEFADGEMIVREGDDGAEMFIVQSGRVVISRHRDCSDTILQVVERGEFFGEMSLLESLPRDADARADGRTRLLVIGPGGLLLRLRRDPSLALEMLHILSGRVRALNQRLDAR